MLVFYKSYVRIIWLCGLCYGYGIKWQTHIAIMASNCFHTCGLRWNETTTLACHSNYLTFIYWYHMYVPSVSWFGCLHAVLCFQWHLLPIVIPVVMSVLRKVFFLPSCIKINSNKITSKSNSNYCIMVMLPLVTVMQSCQIRNNKKLCNFFWKGPNLRPILLEEV